MIELVTPEEKTLAALFQKANAKVKYEPKIFRIHGKKKMGFRPDFYLAEIDLYVEVGNLNTKRKKMRMMRGHFPQVKVLFLDNKEVDLINQIEAAALLSILESFHNQTHYRGLSLEARYQLLKKLINYEGASQFARPDPNPQ